MNFIISFHFIRGIMQDKMEVTEGQVPQGENQGERGKEKRGRVFRGI